jgi:hypothetical protein
MRTRQPRRETEEEGMEGGQARLPEELMTKVLEMMQPAGQDGGWGFTQSSASVRLVCSQWRAIYDALVTRLELSWDTTDEAVGMLVKRFPAVMSFEMKADGWSVLTEEAMRAVSNLSKLTFLNINFCEEVTDAGLRAVSSMPALTFLNICGCKLVTNAGVRALSSMPQLNSLNISRCWEVTDVALLAVSNMPKLTSLDIYGCIEVTDVGVRSVSSIPALTFLDISWCKEVTDVGVRAVSSLPVLTFVDLRGCNTVTAAGVQALRTAAPSLHIESNYE